MFNKLKNAIARFMYGRYGADNLNRALLVIYAVILVLGLFLGGVVKLVLSLLALTLAIIILARMFSKNIYMP